MTRKEEEKAELVLRQYTPPKNYGGANYLYTIRYCPGYKGYRPDNLTHEICKYCGGISYYH